MYVFANPNPKKLITDDCVIRAICIAEQRSWEDIYVELLAEGFMEKEMPNSNYVWGKYLTDKGYTRHLLADSCPLCYSVREFSLDHPKGVYIVATGTHAVCVIHGDWFDVFDSGSAVPLYYFSLED
jgi:hypothetical protein